MGEVEDSSVGSGAAKYCSWALQAARDAEKSRRERMMEAMVVIVDAWLSGVERQVGL